MMMMTSIMIIVILLFQLMMSMMVKSHCDASHRKTLGTHKDQIRKPLLDEHRCGRDVSEEFLVDHACSNLSRPRTAFNEDEMKNT